MIDDGFCHAGEDNDDDNLLDEPRKRNSRRPSGRLWGEKKRGRESQDFGRILEARGGRSWNKGDSKLWNPTSQGGRLLVEAKRKEKIKKKPNQFLDLDQGDNLLWYPKLDQYVTGHSKQGKQPTGNL
ncbi:hypothetical protein TIFTF001_006528 [Ficus carica]|uniref:Uncharacterized protein n=1 Tax=Ficus carica TaxID=3494 RepID=A0AA87ZHM3_FICCA|nr:hypothetical protein TIFTF001_006528 [Ficus carica]